MIKDILNKIKLLPVIIDQFRFENLFGVILFLSNIRIINNDHLSDFISSTFHNSSFHILWRHSHLEAVSCVI